MKLRTKLLLGVGILLLIMVVLMYLLPAFFVKRDVYKAANNIQSLIVDEHKELTNSQKVWLENELEWIEQKLDSILFMIYEEPLFSSQLVMNEENSALNVWEAMTRIAGFEPEIGLIQVHAPDEKKTAVISPHTADFYPASVVSKPEGFHILLTHHDEKADEIFIGIPLPKELQSEAGYTLYALIDEAHAGEEEELIKKEIGKLTPELLAKHEKQFVVHATPEQAPAYYWAIKIDMIRSLAPLLVEGLEFTKGEKTFVPEGIARIDTSGNGFAVLSEEVFHMAPVFDDVEYFDSHTPPSSAPPLATGAVLIPAKDHKHAYVGNTLKIKNTFLTIANPLSMLVKQLALSSNKVILLHVDNSFWIAFDGEGNRLSEKEVVALDPRTHARAEISRLREGKLIFYSVQPLGGYRSIVQTLLDLENNLSHRISLQLSLIAAAAMVLVLLFIARIGFSVIAPITKLAHATEDVVAGRYEAVTLPDVGKRQDEVATLTRSFGQMVKGLEEREKIRGVLDKVVSKDVADEILRTHIHLGGEDRVVTMLFSDIRGFTKLTENFSPQDTIEMLNVCMTKISRVIEGEGGVIDKYVGDEVMAIYGAPAKHPDHALRAVSSGMLMIEMLKQWNQERVAAGEVPVEMGIGIHTGLVVAGNMGAEDRLNYTVLGANVNLAARLCDAAEPGQLIISEATLKQSQVANSFYMEPLPPIALRGITEPVKIYQVSGFKWEEE